jgi:hypothetical protein
MAESPSSTNGDELPDIVIRPSHQLHDLPVQFRWEATRRHPYYLTFWQEAARYRADEEVESAERLLLQAAHLMLGAIGAFGLPINPGTNFEELDDGSLDPAFLSGAVQPISMRVIASMLMRNMPTEELAVLGAFFMNAAGADYEVEGDDDNQSLQKLNAITHLDRIYSPFLDSYADIPFFYMHIEASQRTITQDVESHARRWKARQNIAEKRVHAIKLPQYLEVWDLREGWNGVEYDVREEHSFREIGDRLQKKVSTVANQHHHAFRMITGHDFSPELWMRLMAPLKRSELFQDAASILSAPMRHRMRSPVRRPVPDSVVSPVSDDGATTVVETESVCQDGQEATDQRLDIESMLRRGLGDDTIAERLECDLETVEYFRVRIEEFRN